MAERPTPTTIAISTLIALYIDPSSPLETVENDELLNVLQALAHKPHQSLKAVLYQLDSVVSKIFVETLTAASTSIDGLVDLMLSIQAVDAGGELGIFVRKTCLGFDKLSFEGMTTLWEALSEEVEQLNEQDGEELSQWPLSAQQKQDLLRIQCLVLDEAVLSQSPFELKEQVQSILEEEQEIPAAHFLKFLHHLQEGSKVGALDALHQYFDYAMIAERKDLKRQVVLHYATLVLAAVHQEFGDTELSEKATEEAIHVAQQSGDPACVAHALSFLYQATGNRSILKRCAVRALEGKLRRLVAGANMTLAQATGPSHQSWEALLDATTDQATSTMTAIDRPTHMEDLASPQAAMEILGQSSLVGAGIWESMGFSGMSALSTEVGLECYGDYLTAATKASAVQNLARKALIGPLVWPNPDKLCRYGIALRIVMEQGSAFGTLALLHEWAVRRGEYGHAQTLIDYLNSRLHPRIPNYEEAKLEVAAQQAFLLARKGWVLEAKTKLEALIKQCRTDKKVVKQAHFLIQLAVTHLDANRIEFRAAVQPVRECMKLAMDHSMDVMHATAASILAQIHYRMGEMDTAIAMLKGILPTLRQNGNVWFVGEAYLTLAKCYLEGESNSLSMENLSRAADNFSDCQDLVRLREVYYLQARLHNVNGDLEQREESSKMFVDVTRQLARGTLATGLGEIQDPDYLEKLAQRQVHSS